MEKFPGRSLRSQVCPNVEIKETYRLYYCPVNPLPEHCLYPANKAVFKPNLDSMGMSGRVGKDVEHDAFGALARPLVFLEHDRYPEAGPYIASVLSIHAGQYEGEGREWQAGKET